MFRNAEAAWLTRHAPRPFVELAGVLQAHARDAAANGEGESVSIRDGEQHLLTIVLPAGEVAIARGGDEPGEGGWVSPRFGVRVAADRIAWRGEVGESGVVTRLFPASP